MKKKCTKCKVEKPMTTEYFSRMKDGFQFQCKECRKKYHTDKREEILRKRKEKYRAEHPLKHTVAFPDGMKLCCKCNELKPSTNEFFNNLKKTKDGFRHECIECRKLEYKNDSERIIEKSRKYYLENKEKCALTNKKYKQRNEEYYRDYAKGYYKENQELIIERVKKNHFKRLEEDLGYKLLQRCRTRIYNALKGRTKSKKTIDLIGCQVEELIERLENKFQEGMTWENYGEWHLDHIKPCAMFDFKDEKQQQECFHYTNLQPLWAEENQRKSASYEESV